MFHSQRADQADPADHHNGVDFDDLVAGVLHPPQLGHGHAEQHGTEEHQIVAGGHAGHHADTHNQGGLNRNRNLEPLVAAHHAQCGEKDDGDQIHRRHGQHHAQMTAGEAVDHQRKQSGDQACPLKRCGHGGEHRLGYGK